MKQIYHSNATTNVRLRTVINKSNLPNNILSAKYDISHKTICKWKKRTEFTDKSSRPHQIKYKKGEYCKKSIKLDVFCKKNNIDHRCTKPFTPKTNGMVEKANDIIKKGTIKKTNYASLKEMKIDLMHFLVHYNLYRRHGSLRKELKVKTPLNAVEKWYELNPKIFFKEKPSEFEIKILSLKKNV